MLLWTPAAQRQFPPRRGDWRAVDNRAMRFLIDFFPIALFVAAYKWQGIYVATGVLMAATVLQTGLIYLIDRKLQTLHKVTLVLVLVFGALTLFLQDERFIKWKPTVLYASMALVLLAALWGWKKNFLQMLLGSQLKLPKLRSLARGLSLIWRLQTTSATKHCWRKISSVQLNWKDAPLV